jgi:23S rRNA pseudouridine2605 synthase
MADAGVAARRACEQLIEQGHVRVNGQAVNRLPVFVDPEQDEIEVDGRRLPKAQRRVYLMLHKPAGTIVSTADEPELGRATVMDLVNHPAAPRLFPVGRLEFDTTGLLIVTNDGELANRITHPRYQVPKVYQALVKGAVDEQASAGLMTKIRAIAEREGVSLQPPQIEVLRRDKANTLLELTMQEGATRHVRDAFELLGMPIKKLTRVAVGSVELKGLAPGHWRELTRDEVNALRRAGPDSRRRRSRAADEPRRRRPKTASRREPGTPAPRNPRAPRSGPRQGAQRTPARTRRGRGGR